MDETTEGTEFVPLTTIVAFISIRLLFLECFPGLILFGQQERGYGAVRFRDNPQLVASVCAIGAQEPESVLKAKFVFLAVLVGQIAPLAVDMAREELARLLSCLLKRGQSARCRDDLAEFECRLFAELLHWKDSFRWFRFCFLRGTAESGALKANALPGGARRLAVRAVKAARFSRSSERSGRALTEEAGGPGAGFQQEGLPKFATPN